jgi:hypothetical protein
MAPAKRPLEYTDEDLDEIVIERLMSGEAPAPPIYDGVYLCYNTIEAIRRLVERGFSDGDISEKFGGRMHRTAISVARHRWKIRAHPDQLARSGKATR